MKGVIFIFLLMAYTSLLCDVIIAPKGLLNASHSRDAADGRVTDTFSITKNGRGVIYLSQFHLSGNHDVEFKPDHYGPEKQIMLVKSTGGVTTSTGSNIYVGDNSGKQLVTIMSSPSFVVGGNVFSTGSDLLLTNIAVPEGLVFAAREDSKIFMLDRALNDGEVERLYSHTLGNDYQYIGAGGNVDRTFVSQDVVMLLGNGAGSLSLPSGGGTEQGAQSGSLKQNPESVGNGKLDEQGVLTNPGDGALVHADDGLSGPDPLEPQGSGSQPLQGSGNIVSPDAQIDPEEESPSQIMMQLLSSKTKAAPQVVGDGLQEGEGGLEEVEAEPELTISSVQEAPVAASTNTRKEGGEELEEFLPDIVLEGQRFDEIEGVGIAEAEELSELKKDARRARRG